MSDFLTQEQIDQLLNVTGGDSDGDASALEDLTGGGSDALAGLREAIEFLNNHASSTIGQILNKDIQFTISECTELDLDTLRVSMGEGLFLSLNITLEGSVEGAFDIIVSTKDTAVLSDLMMMGDGTAEYTDDHRDAIGEMFNQVMGAFTTALGDHCGESVSVKNIEVNDFSFDSPDISFDDTKMVIQNIAISELEDSVMAMIIDRDTSEALASKFVKDTGGGEITSDESIDFENSYDNDVDDDDDLPVQKNTRVAASQKNIDMLLDIEMDIAIELGTTEMSIKKVLELGPGSVVELDRLAGEPVDLLVNSKVVAKGEVVVVDETFAIRIVSLVSPEERIKSLR